MALREVSPLCLGIHLTQGDTCDDDGTNRGDGTDYLVPMHTGYPIRHRLHACRNLDECLVPPLRDQNRKILQQTSNCDTRPPNTNLCFNVGVRILVPAIARLFGCGQLVGSLISRLVAARLHLASADGCNVHGLNILGVVTFGDAPEGLGKCGSLLPSQLSWEGKCALEIEFCVYGPVRFQRCCRRNVFSTRRCEGAGN